MLSKVFNQTFKCSLSNDHSAGRPGLRKLRIFKNPVQGENNYAAGGRDAIACPSYQPAQVEEIDPCPPEKWADTDVAATAKALFAIQGQKGTDHSNGTETAPAKFAALLRRRKCKIGSIGMVEGNSGVYASPDFT